MVSSGGRDRTVCAAAVLTNLALSDSRTWLHNADRLAASVGLGCRRPAVVSPQKKGHSFYLTW